MKILFKPTLFAILLVTLFMGGFQAQALLGPGGGGGLLTPSALCLVSANVWSFCDTSDALGDVSNPISNGYFTSFTAGTLTIGGAITDLTVSGNTILGDASTDTLLLNTAVITSASPTTWTINTSYTWDDGSNTLLLLEDNGSSGKLTVNTLVPTTINFSTTNITDTLDEDDMASNSATALATQQSIKAYVDTSSAAFDIDYFFNNTASDIGGIYFDMTSVALGGAETTDLETSGLTAGNPDQPLVNFLTDEQGGLGILGIPAGTFEAHFHAEKTTGTSDVNIYAKIYKRASGGTETLITTSQVSGLVTSKADFSLFAHTTSDIDLLATDRIVVKFFANLGSGNGATVEIYAEGTTVARLAFPTTSEILNQIFIRQDGTKPLIANWDAGAFDIRALTVTADSLTSGRVPFASTNGLLVDDADFTFNTDTLLITKIGIGTSTPATVLHAISTSEQLRLGFDFDSYASFTIDTNGDLLITATGGDISFGDENVGTTGKIGAGTTTPNQILTVEGTMTIKEQADANSDNVSYGQLWVDNTTPNVFKFTDDTGTDFTLNDTTDNLRFLTFVLIESATDVAVDTDVGGDFVMPFSGTFIQDDNKKNYLSAYNTTAGSTGTMVIDIHLNGTTIMDTNKLDIETGEKNTDDATTQPDLSTTTFSAGDIITIDIDAIHTTEALGLKVQITVRPN